MTGTATLTFLQRRDDDDIFVFVRCLQLSWTATASFCSVVDDDDIFVRLLHVDFDDDIFVDDDIFGVCSVVDDDDDDDDCCVSRCCSTLSPDDLAD